MASESYKLQINDSCVTSIGLKHVLKSLILNFDGSTKRPLLGLQRDHVLNDCPQKLHVKRFHLQQLAGPIDSKQHTPIKLIGLLLDKAVKTKEINPVIILFE
jgi:hypothetical protein